MIYNNKNVDNIGHRKINLRTLSTRKNMRTLLYRRIDDIGIVCEPGHCIIDVAFF